MCFAFHSLPVAIKILTDTQHFINDSLIVLSGDDRNIEEVYVGGKQVVPFSSSV